MGNELTNEKEADESLSSAAAKGDALEDNTPVQGEKAGESSSILDAVKQGLKEQGATLTSTAEEEGGKQLSSETEPNAEEKAAADKEKEQLEKSGDKEKEDLESEEKKGEEGQEKKEAVPYERFHEVVEQRTKAEEMVKEYEPMVKNYRNITSFCEQSNITAEQFEKALRVQALLNTDPDQALKELEPIVNSLKGYVGDKLPEDLQKKVDEGKMEVDDARELARLRAKEKFSATRAEHTQKANAIRQREYVEQQMATESEKWESAKRASDPDYRPKKDESAPDGKWELVRDKYLAAINMKTVKNGEVVYVNPVSTPQQMLALLESVYKQVDGTFQNLRGRKPATRKALSSNGSSSVKENASVEDAPDMATAISRGMKKLGYTVG